MDLKEIGEHLRREREKQGLSLDDVIQKTKISRRNLKAIEQGDHEDLPHPVYAKGFVKNYAHFLGLDVEEIADLFARNYSLAGEEFSEQEPEEAEAEEVPAFEPIKEKHSWPIVSIVLTVVLILVLGWLVYDVYFTAPEGDGNVPQEKQALSSQTKDSKPAAPGKNETKKTSETVQDASGLSEQVDSSNKSAQGAENATELAEKEKQVAPEEESEGKQLSETEEAETISETATEPVLEAENNNAGQGMTANETQQVATNQVSEQKSTERPSAEPLKSKKHVVEISAFEACWFSAKFDGKDRDVYLRPGEGITLRFSKSLRLRLGNAGGVNIKFDGKAYPLDVESGEVKTLTFP